MALMRNVNFYSIKIAFYLNADNFDCGMKKGCGSEAWLIDTSEYTRRSLRSEYVVMSIKPLVLT
jgi:hypothetical protein